METKISETNDLPVGIVVQNLTNPPLVEQSSERKINWMGRDAAVLWPREEKGCVGWCDVTAHMRQRRRVSSQPEVISSPHPADYTISTGARSV